MANQVKINTYPTSTTVIILIARGFFFTKHPDIFSYTYIVIFKNQNEIEIISMKAKPCKLWQQSQGLQYIICLTIYYTPIGFHYKTIAP